MLAKEADLISLMTERQREIRHTCQEIWNDRHDVYVADSEWSALKVSAAVENMSISEMSKHLGISRQAAHKIVKSMESKELVRLNESRQYKNRKYIIVTDRGREYDLLYQELKEELIEKIEKTIGEEDTERLKRLLSQDWGMTSQ